MRRSGRWPVGALALALQADAASALLAALGRRERSDGVFGEHLARARRCLLAGSALALLGAMARLQRARRPRKAAGYTADGTSAPRRIHGQGAPGWLVPGLALITLIVWERRWSELRRWSCTRTCAAGLIIGPWVWASRSPSMGGCTAALFWKQRRGTIHPGRRSRRPRYTTGHHNTAGKYLFELPLYLLP